MCPKGDGDSKDNKSGGNEEYKPPSGGGGKTDVIKVNDKEVTFGHGGRHLEGTGLLVSQVNSFLASYVTKLGLVIGQFYKGQVTIGGVIIEFTAYVLSDGTINIGTYYPIVP